MVLTGEKLITFKKPKELTKEYAGCGLNSIMTLLDNLYPNHDITIEGLKEIFQFDADGISHQKYRFNKFNTILNSKGIPLKLYKAPFNTWQDLVPSLRNNFPIPIFFSMKVIEFIKSKFKYSQMQFNFGNVFEDDVDHLLLFMGYDKKGDALYFMDPIYQLPYYQQSYIKNKEKLIKLSPKQFHECTKHIKSYMQVRSFPTLTKKSEKKKSPQKKLNEKW